MINRLLLTLTCMLLLFSCAEEGGFSNSTGTTGTNGSYSRMVIVDNYMYRVDTEVLTTFDITDPEDISQLDRQMVGFTIESIYHMGGILFIGSGEALHIFEIGENGIPERRSRTDYSQFSEEQVPCDPVISDGNFAYVTLSTVEVVADGPCNRLVPINELRIYDITDLNDPKEVNRIEMLNPKGLAYDGDLLFICENDNGLKVFDKSDINNLELIEHFKDFNTYDVIAKNGLLIVIGRGAIYQFDYQDREDITLISTLEL